MQPLGTRTLISISTWSTSTCPTGACPNWIGRFLACALIACLAPCTSLAQFPGGRGDRDFGGGQGGGGQGGDRRGGGFNAEDFFKRMDANENGILEPSEIPEDRRRFLERIAGDIDWSQPVPIDKLQESMQAARERMGRGGMGGRPGAGDGDLGERSRGGNSNRDGANRGGANRDGGSGNRPDGSSSVSPQSTTKKPDSQVAGFGAPTATVQVRGFGGAPSATGGGAVSAVAAGASPATATTSGAATGPDPRIGSVAAGIIKGNDKNGDGVLEKAKGEWDDLGSTSRNSDANGDGKITLDELVAKLGNYSNQRGGDASSPATTASAPSQVASSVGGATSTSGRKSYRVKTPRERLPSDIPGWFSRSDEDGDGQLLMSEYARAWTDSKVSEFARYDLNGDGVITAKECLKAERK